jgi:hypothetical protein
MINRSTAVPPIFYLYLGSLAAMAALAATHMSI